MKYLGVDYGTKRIGLAVSDETGSIAFPLTIVDAGPQALSEVDALIKKNGVEKIVLGESRNLVGEPNLLMEDIEQFKADIAELSGLAVEYEPEFFSSAQAARKDLDKRGVGNVDTKKLDASAAALILQSYLDRQKNK